MPRAIGLTPGLVIFFLSHRTQGRAHCAEPAPQAPSQSYGTPIHASLIIAAVFEGGWRPRLAHQLMIQCVETASLGKHRVRVGSCWALGSLLPHGPRFPSMTWIGSTIEGTW